MWKYLKMIPVIFYPYAYLIVILVMFITRHASEFSWFFSFIFIYGFFVNILAFVFSITNMIQTVRKKYTTIEATKINLIVKLCQIPAYILNFVLGLVGVVMNVWGIPIIAFAIIVDCITIFMTGFSQIGCSSLLYKDDKISSTLSTWLTLGSFIYVIDVVIAIIYFVLAIIKKDNKDNAIINNME